jgi:hypothetical protein
MARKTARKIDFSDAAQMSVRMLIASYFMAGAIGSIPGADTGALLAPLLPEPLSRIVAGSSSSRWPPWFSWASRRAWRR